MDRADGYGIDEVDPILNKIALGKIGPQAADLVMSIIERESEKIKKKSYNMFKQDKMDEREAFIMMQGLYILESIKKDIEKLFERGDEDGR